MYDIEIPHRQLTAWLVAGIVPAVIQLTSGAPWFSVSLVCVLSLLLVWLRWALGTTPKGKIMTLFQWGIAVIVLGTACQYSVKSWPQGGHPAVAIVLLLLAVWSCSKGASASARVSCVLFWVVLGVYLILLGAGAKDIRINWLLPTTGDVDAFGCVLLLTPAAGAIHLYKRESLKPRLLLIGVFCIAAAMVTVGVLSPQIAGQKENAFYEMTRSLNLLGQARRFEAILSACMTVGWFSIISLYLSICGKLVENNHKGYGKWGSLAAAALATVWLLCDLHIPDTLLLVWVTVFWVVMPLVTQGLGVGKKS